MGSVVVATSKGFVRFLSSSGIQRYVWRVGEEMVSMAAGREAVIIVHREGGTSLDGRISSRDWSALTPRRMSESAVLSGRPRNFRADTRGSCPFTEEDDAAMGGVHLGWGASNIRLVRIVVRARSISEIWTGEMGTFAGLVLAREERREAGIVLASGSDQYAFHMCDPQGLYRS